MYLSQTVYKNMIYETLQGEIYIKLNILVQQLLDR